MSWKPELTLNGDNLQTSAHSPSLLWWTLHWPLLCARTMPVTCVGPGWMPPGIQPLREEATAPTLVAQEAQGKWWRISHIYRCWGVWSVPTELSLPGWGGKGFPEVATPNYACALPSFLPFPFLGAFLAVSQIPHQTQHHHSLSLFLHGLKNNCQLPASLSHWRERSSINSLRMKPPHSGWISAYIAQICSSSRTRHQESEPTKVIGGTRCKLVGNRVVGDTLDRIIVPGK